MEGRFRREICRSGAKTCRTGAMKASAVGKFGSKMPSNLDFGAKILEMAVKNLYNCHGALGG